ncbi:ribonuclease H-like domain-containing protein [Scleroderma yunnanense]
MENTVPARYTFCNNLPSVAYAARVLARSPVLLIDCEGRNIGGLDGVLSLVCIGTERAEHVFVFDALALRSYSPRVRPLLNSLLNPSVKKVMWDCRNDFLEIFSEYGVALQSIVDLQLAEIQARMTVKKEREFNRISRLAAGGRRLPLRLIKQNPELFFGVHSLQGMDSCIRETKLPTTGKDPQVVAMHKANGSTIWLERPLSPQLLAYAAHDIELLGTLYEHFKEICWITPANEPTLMAQSLRYAYSLSHQGRVAEDNVFGSSAVLPLDVLTEPRGLKVPCHGCHRMQSLHCFSVLKHNSKPHSRTNICRVCQIKLLIKEKKYPIVWLGVSVGDVSSFPPHG